MTELLYVDLETGGIPVITGIYEVGLIATKNGQILDSMTIGLVINSDRLSEGMGQGYACISDDEQYINQFKQFVAKYPFPFVAHNASFDKGFLTHYGWVEPNAKFIDTLELFREKLPRTEIANHKLGTIMEHYGVQVDGTLHTAIADLKGLVEAVNKSGILGDFVENTNLNGATTSYSMEYTYLVNYDASANEATIHCILEQHLEGFKYKVLKLPNTNDSADGGMVVFEVEATTEQLGNRIQDIEALLSEPTKLIVPIKYVENAMNKSKVFGVFDVVYKEIHEDEYKRLFALPSTIRDNSAMRDLSPAAIKGYGYYGSGLAQINDKYYLTVNFGR